MKKQLTNVRTFLQFSQYEKVKQITFNGNKFMAMNVIKNGFGVNQFSAITEYLVTNFLPVGNYTIN